MLRTFVRKRKSAGRTSAQMPAADETPLPADIETTITAIDASMGSSELVVHRFKAFSGKCAGVLMCLKSLVDTEELSKSILSPLLKLTSPPASLKDLAAQDLPLTGI
ncbi:MAG TPA: hypothetical protein VNU93_07760, partial [Verrucomicrobiae bacterium]|nr:hypothetical protein [Verrucomicrobiae bacterium]